MKSFAATTLLAAALAETSAVTPVEKVVHLLNGMLESGKKSKHEEVVQFAAFKQFCDDTASQKKLSIKEGGEKMEILKADIAKAVADTNQLQQDIAEHDDDIAVWEGDKKAATSVRNIEKRDYDIMHADYDESIEALRKAIKVLKQQNRKHMQAEDLLQLNEKMKRLQLIPAAAKKAIDIFLQQGFNEGLATANQASVTPAYEANVDKVVDMLEKLMDKFVDERTALEKDEMNAEHAFKMLVQDLETQIRQGTIDVGEARTLKSEKLQGKADAADDLKEATNNKEADEKYLSDLLADCQFKAVDYEKRQVMRAEEIKAIEKAIEIISSDKVSGAAEEHLPALIQRTALAQLRSDARSPQQQHASDFLLARGHGIHSKVLLSVATHVASDPFKKVKRMIKDLILKLMEEANEEAGHKGWCDTELSTNEQTRKEKTEAVELLHAEIDELKASLTKLSNEITDLSTSTAELNRAMAEATSIRQAEKAKNEATLKDAQDAQMAVEQAIMVLRDFYAKAADAEASAAAGLVQRPSPAADAEVEAFGVSTEEASSKAASLMQRQKKQPAITSSFDIAEAIESAVPDHSEDDTSCLDRGDCAPELHGASRQPETALVTEAAKTKEAAKAKASPVQAAKGQGVLDMLDVILSDFAHLEAKTDGAEATAERQYKEFMTDSQVDKAEKETSLKHKTAKRQDEEQTLVTKKADLEGTQHELDSALGYFDKLKPSCVDSGVSYEDRVSRRKEEVESLQEALRILDGEDLA